MKSKFVDCFLLMNTALSLKGGGKLSEMGRLGSETTVVNISIHVGDFLLLNTNNMEFQISLTSNQQWLDPRLGANIQTRKKAVTGKIWQPKILNINGIQQSCPNENTIFWRGYGDEGRILLSELLVLNHHCTVDFAKFPFDKQTCELKFGTYRFNSDEVELQWGEKAIDYTSVGVVFKDFTLLDVLLSKYQEERRSGNFSMLSIEFIMQRNVYSHLLKSILPNFLMTLLSYVTLWIPKQLSIQKYIMNTLAILFLMYFFCITNISNHGMNFMDLFMIENICFATLSLFEAILDDFLMCFESVDSNNCKFSTLRYGRNLFKFLFPMFYVIATVLTYLYYVGANY